MKLCLLQVWPLLSVWATHSSISSMASMVPVADAGALSAASLTQQYAPGCQTRNPTAPISGRIPSRCVRLVRGVWCSDIPLPEASGSGPCGGIPLLGPVRSFPSRTGEFWLWRRISYDLRRAGRWWVFWSGLSTGSPG